MCKAFNSTHLQPSARAVHLYIRHLHAPGSAPHPTLVSPSSRAAHRPSSLTSLSASTARAPRATPIYLQVTHDAQCESPADSLSSSIRERALRMSTLSLFPMPKTLLTLPSHPDQTPPTAHTVTRHTTTRTPKAHTQSPNTVASKIAIMVSPPVLLVVVA